MKKPILAILALILANVACVIQVGGAATPAPTLPLTPSPTTTPTPDAPTGQATQAQTALVIAGAVNVRSEPDGAVVGQIYAGQSVTVEGCKDGWCEISTDVLSGWVFEGCLSVDTERKCEAR